MHLLKIMSIFCLSLLSSVTYAQVIELKTISDVNNLIASNEKVVIKFSASFCGPCQRIKEPYKQLSNQEQFNSVTFASVDFDAAPELIRHYKVNSFPTFIYIRNGSIVDRDEGVPGSMAKRIEEELKVGTEDRKQQSIKSVSTPVKEITVPAPLPREGAKGFLENIKETVNKTWQWIKNSITQLFPGR